ncbi:hypothetical protein C7S18_04475 [Ahniella affigens]|uniref:AraC-type arabinose-binding/dimerisation domain-containing protein n=1 Tax=Ahniella affigens TaxID=2021234 RepID=A0A2P1PNU6_9GAMM|nr:hypothetical protein C7S18_04475 [Ahniella affigens]
MKIISNPNQGDSIDARDTMYPSSLVVVSGKKLFESVSDTLYGVVLSGRAQVVGRRFQFGATVGGYFCATGGVTVEADGLVVLIERLGFRGITSAGIMEERGRLTYIDGCTSTILVAPPRLGDPVLNHLHFPAEVRQTEHVHPSIRLGVVTKGSGVAIGSNPSGGAKWEERLYEGSVFMIPAQERHAFHTIGSTGGMDIVSYHPESDWGPTDSIHPMLTRTYASSHGH